MVIDCGLLLCLRHQPLFPVGACVSVERRCRASSSVCVGVCQRRSEGRRALAFNEDRDVRRPVGFGVPL